ncbi:MAG TPA: hypothetical protein VFZ17_02135 [Acidimicrobiia bacterium]|nr:hypothetical protein [Acidimicrobiia bacterium]
MTDDTTVIDDAPAPDAELDDTTDAADAADADANDTAHRPSLGPVIALGLAVAVALAAIVVAIVGGDNVSPTAVRVNTREVSQKTFDAQLGDLAPALRDQQEQGGAPVTVTDASVPSASAARLASLYVTALLLQDELDRAGVTITDAQLQSFASENRKVLSPYGSSLRDFLVRLNVMQNAMIDNVGEDQANTLLTRAARRADIHVDPRYGFWNPARGEVCPPNGCAAASSGSASSASGG